jgi:chitinase
MTHQSGLNIPLNRDIPQIKGDEHDDFAKDPCPNSVSTYSGEFQWRTIEESGAAYNASGWSTFWDRQTSTPYAYKDDNNQFITFDNPTSLRIKSQYVRENKLGGIMLWSLEMDDEANSLLNAIQEVRT